MVFLYAITVKNVVTSQKGIVLSIQFFLLGGGGNAVVYTNGKYCLHTSVTEQSSVAVSYTHLDVYKRQYAITSWTLS